MGPRRRRVVVWSRSARDDLDEAIAYVAEDSPRNAVDLLGRLLQAADSLDELSERGRIVPERGDVRIREVLEKPFRLLYYVGDAEIVILAVLHERRDFEGWNRTRGSTGRDAP